MFHKDLFWVLYFLRCTSMIFPSVCPNTNIQMYADDTVIYIHGSSVSQVANELTESLVHVAAWLEQCCLQLNISKIVCMFITKTKNLSVCQMYFYQGKDYKLYLNISTLVFWLIPNFHLRRRLKRSVTGSDLVYQILDYSWLYVVWRRSDVYHSMIILILLTV